MLNRIRKNIQANYNNGNIIHKPTAKQIAFLEQKISFTAISRVVRAVLDKDWSVVPSTYDEVFEQDKKSRAYAREQLI